MKDITKVIKNLLETKYSGGAKLIELLPDLMEHFEPNSTLEVSELIKEIEQSPDLAVVKYHWDMGDNIFREKYFIYINYKTVILENNHATIPFER
jgi:3-dehydroquinate dehydratase